jgi:hypothetical protein
MERGVVAVSDPTVAVIVVVPSATPFVTPVVAPMDATEGALEDQVASADTSDFVPSV